MKLKKLTASLFMTFILPTILLSQSENIDLAMMYKIRQEGFLNSQIENLAYELTDLVGPRLTGSTASTGEWSGQKIKWKSLDSKT